MTVLITGFNGQLGSYLTDLYLTKGEKVIGVKRRSSDINLNRVNNLIGNKELIVEEADITDLFSLVSLLEKYKPTKIINTAAQSHVHTSFSQPGYTFDCTGKGVLNILEAIRFCNYSPRFIQMSSSEMFGDQFDIDENGLKYQDENTVMNPQSPYAIAKLAGYHMVRLYRKSYDLFASNVIAFNYESPFRGENFVTRKITKWIGEYLKNNSIPKLKLGNIDSSRDWLHAADMSLAVDKILNFHRPEDFVICSSQTKTVRDFLDVAFKYVNLDWQEHVEIDKSLFRPSEVPYLRGSYKRANSLLGWKPLIPFDCLVQEMVEYDTKNS